jgi:hypothetical protein
LLTTGNVGLLLSLISRRVKQEEEEGAALKKKKMEEWVDPFKVNPNSLISYWVVSKLSALVKMNEKVVKCSAHATF